MEKSNARDSEKITEDPPLMKPEWGQAQPSFHPSGGPARSILSCHHPSIDAHRELKSTPGKLLAEGLEQSGALRVILTLPEIQGHSSRGEVEEELSLSGHGSQLTVRPGHFQIYHQLRAWVASGHG